MGLISRVSSRTYRSSNCNRVLKTPNMPRSRSRSRERDDGELYSVRIGNELPDDISEGELRDKFDTFGKIGEVYIPIDRNSGKSKGFAFVRFCNKDDRENCLEDAEKEPVYIDGLKCKVDFARSRVKGGGRLPPPETLRRRSRSRSRGRYRSRSRSRSRSRRRRRSRSRSRRRSRSRSGRRRSGRRSYSRSRSRSRNSRSSSSSSTSSSSSSS